MFSYNFFYRYYIIFVMIFPSLFYIPKFFEYENVNVSKNYTVVRPCQLPIDFTICHLVVLNNDTDVTNDIFNVTNDTFEVTNDISNVKNDTLSNSTMWKFNKTMIFNSTQLQFTEFRSNKFHKQVSFLPPLPNTSKGQCFVSFEAIFEF